MDQVDKNPYQKHLSGWTISELKKEGFKVNGVSGLKFFYNQENHVSSLLKGKPYQNIRFRPRNIFYGLNAISQIFNYYYPKYSFGLFAVRQKK